MAYGVYKVGVCDDEVGSCVCFLRRGADGGGSTLFWAGETFAPLCMVNTRTGLPTEISPLGDGDASENIQTFLQGRFMAMYERLVDTLTDIPGVLGFEVRPLSSHFTCTNSKGSC